MNAVVTSMVLSLAGVGLDNGMGVSAIDLYFVLVFAIAASSIFLLSRGLMRRFTNAT